MPKPVKSDPPAGRLSLVLGHLIFLGVFLLRLGAVLRLTHSSLLLPGQGDMHFYNDWAKDILHCQFSQHLAFYGLPGYAYLLAFLYKFFGENPFVPGFLQAGIEAGVAVLIYQICLRVLDSVASTLFVKARLIGLFAALFKADPAVWRNLVARAVVVFAGVALGTSPCWIHNYLSAKDPVFLSAHSGINFWIGNNPEATGYPRFPPGIRAGQAAMLQDSITQAEAVVGRSLKHQEVSGYWSGKARTYIASHPGDWLALLARKLRNFWSAFQYDDLSIITSLREQNVIFPGISFGLVAAFAIPGIFLGWTHAPRSRWVLAAVLLPMFALLGVFITERYRLVAVPGLLIFAGLGLSILRKALAAREFKNAAIYLALLTLATIFVAWPQRDRSLWALDAYNSGWQALESNNLSLAEKKLAVAYAYVPENSETLFALGNLRFAQNDPGAAQSFYRAVLNLDSQHKGAFNNLGVIALDAKKYPEAEKWFRHAEDVDPRNAKTHFLLAKSLLAKNDLRAARVEIDAAIALKPEQPEFRALKQQIEEDSQ